MVCSINDPRVIQMVNEAREKGIRPSIEAVPIISRDYNSRWYCGFESGRKENRLGVRTGKFKFPGGGIGKHESPLEALIRELWEEIGVLYSPGPSGAPEVLVIGEMPTSRPNWKSKMRIITYVMLPSEEFVLNGELINPKRFEVLKQLAEQVDCCARTRPEAAVFYKKAIAALPNVLW